MFNAQKKNATRDANNNKQRKIGKESIFAPFDNKDGNKEVYVRRKISSTRKKDQTESCSRKIRSETKMMTKKNPGRRKVKQEKEKDMIAAAWTEKAEAVIETREIVLYDQETNANTAAKTKGNDNRTQGKTERTTEMTEVNESDNMTVTRDERPGHRMMADDVIDPCDFSSTTMLEVAVQPKCDMDAGKSDGNEIENDAVRPKCDEDAASKHEKKAKDSSSSKKITWRIWWGYKCSRKN